MLSPRGLWGMCPKIKLRDKLQTLTNLPPSGTQGPGKFLANEGGKKLGGTGGRSPHDGGVGGVPHKNKIRGQ